MEYPLFVMQEVPKMGVKQGGESFELEMGVWSVVLHSSFPLVPPIRFSKEHFFTMCVKNGEDTVNNQIFFFHSQFFLRLGCQCVPLPIPQLQTEHTAAGLALRNTNFIGQMFECQPIRSTAFGVWGSV